MSLRRSLLIASVSLTPACGGEELTPADVAGSYTLARIENQPLPQLLFSGTTCDNIVVRGSLDLSVDSEFEILLDQVVDCRRTGGDSSDVGRLTVGTYRIDGTRLILRAVSSDIRELQARMSGDAVLAQLPVLSGAPATKEFTFAPGAAVS